MARRLVHQQRHPASRIRLTQETEEGRKVRVLQGRATPEDSRPCTEVDGTPQDAFRVPPRHRDLGLFTSQSPRTTQDGQEAQHRLILPEEPRLGWELPEPADSRAFFCARCGAFSSEK
jgi:hypothetical protein